MNETARPFLTARWADLLLVTYALPADTLRAYLHPALEPDLWSNAAHVSLVAFRFLDTRILGLPIPGHRHFAEINLRAYVRHGSDRGVVFIREFVPRRAIAWVANAWYNEPYATAPITATVNTTPENAARAHFTWRWRGRTHRLAMTGSPDTSLPPRDSDAFLTKEHEWGFGQTRRGNLLRYHVTHPEWPVRTVTALDLEVDYESLYGPGWAFMNTAAPVSTIYAVGSPVTVGWPERLPAR